MQLSCDDLDLAACLLQSISTSLLAGGRCVPNISSSVAIDLYSGPIIGTLESIYTRAAIESVPRAVKRIFDLAVDSTLSTFSSMTVLAMVERLIEVEAGTLGHLNGTTWLATLVASMETVSESLSISDG